MIGDKWIQELKAGDVVFVTTSLRGVYQECRVVRVTPTQIIVGFTRGDGSGYEKRFNRLRGRSIGGSGWSHQYLHQDTPALRDEIELGRLNSKARSLRDNLSIPGDKPTLLAFIAALTPFVPKKDAVNHD